MFFLKVNTAPSLDQENVIVSGGSPRDVPRVPRDIVTEDPVKLTDTFPPTDGVRVPREEVMAWPRRPIARLAFRLPVLTVNAWPERTTPFPIRGTRVPLEAVTACPVSGTAVAGIKVPRERVTASPDRATTFPIEGVNAPLFIVTA